MRVSVAQRIFLGAILLMSAHSACADWSYEFVRITCIPESHYLKLEQAEIPSYAVAGDGDELETKQYKQLKKVWRRHGFYEPKNLNVECRFADATYRVIATATDPASSGMCGGDPHTTLSLLRGGKPVLDKLIFGGSCFRPSVSSVEILNGPLFGSLCVQKATSGGDQSPALCKDLDVPPENPIDQEWIEANP